jgi:uncharacterized membrane protein
MPCDGASDKETYRMNLYDWLLLGHILGAMLWLGGGLVLVLIGRRARASEDPGAIGDFARSLSYLGPRALAPGVGAVLVFGVWMVLADGDWSFGQAWVLIAIGLFVLAFLIGAVYLSRLALALERVGTQDPTFGRALFDRWQAAYGVVLALLVVAAWDMVFKPWL